MVKISVVKEVGSKGEVVIPKKMRTLLGLKKGTKVNMVLTDNGIFLKPKTKSLDKLLGMGGKKKILNEKELDLISHEIWLDFEK